MAETHGQRQSDLNLPLSGPNAALGSTGSAPTGEVNTELSKEMGLVTELNYE